MSKTKRFLAGLVTSAMLMGVTSGIFAAIPADVTGTKYEEAATVLGALNIMIGDDQGKFRPDDALKRSEFSKIAVNELGLEGVASASNHQTKFPDVISNHWANGYINVSVNQGLVIGDDKGNFRPDDSISFAEAVTVLVRMLGYEPQALSRGSWPTGHLVVGAQIGITKGVQSLSADQPITRGMLSQMAFNALTIKLMEQTGFGSDIKYEVTEKTILGDKLDVTEIKGQVVATADTRLGGSSGLQDDEVQIGEETYKTGTVDMTQLLGFKVNAYIHEDASGDETVLSVVIDKNKNSYMSIVSDNFQSFEAGQRPAIKYWVNKDTDNNTKTAYLASAPTMIFNGQYTEFNADLLNPAEGSVTLLDTNRDDDYDIVFVTSYDNYVVDDTSTLSHSISDKYGHDTLVLDPDNTDIRFTLVKEGKSIEVADLKEWDVISVKKSLNGSLIKAEVINKSVTGKVVETDGEKLKINDAEYEIAANYRNAIEVSDEGTFYLDAQGKIAGVDTVGTLSSNYAYLINAGVTGTFGSDVEFKIFNKNGETKIIKGTEKIKLNNDQSKDASVVLESLKDNGTVKAQLITFETNSEGLLTAIRTAFDNTTSGSYNRGVFTWNSTNADAVYKSVSGKLGNINVNSNTVVFDIPTGVVDTDDYAVRNKDMFVNDSHYSIQVYDMAEDLTAKVVIVTNSSGRTNIESPIAVVNKISLVKNDKNENVEKLYAYYNGAEIALVSAQSGILVKEGGAALEQGDIIQFKTNVKNEIDKIDVLFDVQTKGVQEMSTPEEGLKLVYGKVESKFTNTINVTVNDANLDSYSLQGVKIYSYDSTKINSNIKVASAADIAKFDPANPSYVFIRMYKDEVKEIVIIK